MGVLDLWLFVALLAGSALLRSWGSAGRFTLIAVAGPAWVLAVDAGTFAVLALTYRWAVPGPGRAAPERPRASRSAGFGVIRRDRALLGLLVLTFGLVLVFAPVYVALPVHVAVDLHAPASLLGWYYLTFSAGTVAGGLVAGHLGRRALWPTVTGMVAGVGVALLPLGLGASGWPALAGLAVAGFVWAPYLPTAMALFQRTAAPADLPAVLAANGALLVLALPLGTALGGVLVDTAGPRVTLLAVAAGLLVLGAGAALLAQRRRVSITDPAPRTS